MSRLGDGGLSRGGLHRSPIYDYNGGDDDDDNADVGVDDDDDDDGGKRFAHVANLE